MDEPKLSRMGLVAWELGSAITAALLFYVVTFPVLIFVAFNPPKPGWLRGALLVLSDIPYIFTRLILNLVGALIGYALARRYRRRFRWGPLLFGLALVPVGWQCACWWNNLMWVWEGPMTRDSGYTTLLYEWYVETAAAHLALVGLLWSTGVLLAELRPRR